MAASADLACHAAEAGVSSVLEAMEVALGWATGTVRLSLGRGTPDESHNVERDIAEGEQALVDLERLDVMTMPGTVIGDEVVVGLDRTQCGKTVDVW